MHCKQTNQTLFPQIIWHQIQLRSMLAHGFVWTILCTRSTRGAILHISHRRHKIRFSQIPPSQRGCSWSSLRGTEGLSDTDECVNKSRTFYQWKRIPQLEASVLCMISGNQIGDNYSSHSSSEWSSWKKYQNPKTNGEDSAQSFNSFHKVLGRSYTNQLLPAQQNAMQCTWGSDDIISSHAWISAGHITHETIRCTKATQASTRSREAQPSQWQRQTRLGYILESRHDLWSIISSVTRL
jgi:hypothetical protein